MSRDDSTKVYVGNLDERTTKRDLERFFERAGTITDMWVARSPPGFAFVYFADRRDAEDACKDLDGREILNRRVRVEVSTGPRRGGGGGGGGGGGAPRGGRGGDDKCYVCGGHGHLARDCRDRRRSRSPRRSRSRSRSPPRRRTSRDRSRSPRRDRDRPEAGRDRSPRRSRSPAKEKDTNGPDSRDREDAQPEVAARD